MKNTHTANKGFSLIEILISMAVLAIVFSFIFYFISSINVKKKSATTVPYMLEQYNYSDKYCYFNHDISTSLFIVNDNNISTYISTSTPVTGLFIFNKNKLIITTNSASTTEPDVFLFDVNIIGNIININPITFKAYDVGPGINDALLHEDMLYVLNTSVNSHVKTLKISADNKSLSVIGDIKINELYASGALPKKIYVTDKNLLVGTEKNAAGGELFVLPLDDSALPKNPTKSIEINGQVNSMYSDQNSLYVANASDIELFVYDKNFKLVNSYDAPLSLGNGKSVLYLDPYVYLGRTVASFELFLLKLQSGVLQLMNTYKAYGTVDFMQSLGQQMLVISSAEDKEFQFFTKDMNLVRSFNSPGRINAYTCFGSGVLFVSLLNNQSHLLWLR